MRRIDMVLEFWKKEYVITALISFLGVSACNGSQIDSREFLRKSGIHIDADVKILLVEHFTAEPVERTEMTVVLENTGSDFEYDRIRIYREGKGNSPWQEIFAKDGLNGTVIGECCCLPKNIISKNRAKYFLELRRRNEFELVFVEWPFSAGYTGNVIILRYGKSGMHLVFDETAEIGWVDLDKDGHLEIITRRWQEGGLQAEKFRPSYLPYIGQDVYQYDEKANQYIVSKTLTEEWVKQKITQEEQQFQHDHDMDGFSLVIQYYIKIGQVDQAVAFFDQAIDYLHYGNGKVPGETREKLRKVILSNKQ